MPRLLLAALALLLAVPAAAQTAGPDASLTPEQVVRIQVEALQHNDDPAPDAGIAVTFRFASPGNRAATGPFTRFAEMIRVGYPDLLGFTEARYGPIQVVGGQAVQAVTFVQPGGREATYLFGLSRQNRGACAGCWMTDAVVEQDGDAAGTRRI